MFKEADILFIYTETPVHAGSGTGLTAVDLPIQRERHTGYPMIQAPGLKGAVREVAEDGDVEHVEILFGPGPDRASEHAGALAFTDARILLFPVRSLAGVFAWVTCPAVLERFRRDLHLVGEGKGSVSDFAIPRPERNQVFVPEETGLAAAEDRLVLEDFDLEMRRDGDVAKIGSLLSQHAFPQEPAYWAEKVTNDLAILHNDDFSHFVESSTEIITRIRLGRDTGTVEEGPWNEEYLPSESLLYSLVLATDPRLPREQRPSEMVNAREVLQHAEWGIFKRNSYMQLGGNETLGRGLVHLRFQKAKDLERGS